MAQTVTVTVRLPVGQAETLRMSAAARHLTVSHVVRWAIDDLMNTLRHRELEEWAVSGVKPWWATRDLVIKEEPWIPPWPGLEIPCVSSVDSAGRVHVEVKGPECP